MITEFYLHPFFITQHNFIRANALFRDMHFALIRELKAGRLLRLKFDVTTVALWLPFEEGLMR